MAGNITAADVIFMITIIPIFPAPQKIQGFMAEDIFDVEAVDIAEIVLGADGRTSAGWIPYNVPQTISIMPDSPTNDIFDFWVAAEKLTKQKYFATATVTLNATGAEYTLSGGILTRITPIPSAKKVLQGRPFVITWSDITKALV
jgi:hypothetical protein